MLLDDDVVTDGKPQASPFSGRFCREEWIKHLLFHLSRNTAAVVADPNLNVIAEILRCGSKNWLMVVRFRFALRRCVKAIRNQVEKRPCNLRGNRSTSPAAASNDRSSLMLKPRCSALAL